MANTFDIKMSLHFVGFEVEEPTKKGERPWPHFAWKVTLTKDDRKLVTPYKCGAAHAKHVHEFPPNASKIWWLNNSPELARARSLATYGDRLTISDCEGYVLPTPPKLEDVLQSLQVDAQSADYFTYESFAAEYDLDPDSRAGERMFNACRETAAKLEKLLGHADFSKFLHEPYDE